MSVIKNHHTPTKGGAWDGPGNEKKLRSGESASYYAKMYAWRDPDGDEGTKGAYKFPHHFVDGDGEPGAASIKGCQTGIAVLNGSMGGADIPDGDRKGVWNHMATHLRDGDVEPAELNSRHGLQDSSGFEGLERRAFPISELRVVEEEGRSPRIEGYAAVFDQRSEDLGGFVEEIDPGAFARTLREADVRALWQHNVGYVLGRMRSGTLRVWTDQRGLRFEAEPPDAQWARDALVTMRRGDVDQASFGFWTRMDHWSNEDGEIVRRLLDVDLFDVSPVTFPAYPQTSAQVRARVVELQVTGGGQGPGPDGGEEERSRARLDLDRRQLELAELEILGGE